VPRARAGASQANPKGRSLGDNIGKHTSVAWCEQVGSGAEGIVRRSAPTVGMDLAGNSTPLHRHEWLELWKPSTV